MREKISQVNEEMRQLDNDLEEIQGEADAGHPFPEPPPEPQGRTLLP